VELPVWRIVIPDQQLNLLKKNVWSNIFVDAYFVNSGVREPIKLRYRGGHTRDYKKNLMK
jgi:spore coat protein H